MEYRYVDTKNVCHPIVVIFDKKPRVLKIAEVHETACSGYVKMRYRIILIRLIFNHGSFICAIDAQHDDATSYTYSFIFFGGSLFRESTVVLPHSQTVSVTVAGAAKAELEVIPTR